MQHATQLLLKGASPNIKCPGGNTPLMDVLYMKDTQTAIAFIRTIKHFAANANYFNKEGICPLFKCITMNDPMLIAALLEIPELDVNWVNMFRLTPIFYAVSNTRRHEIISILLKAGADPSISAAFTMRSLVVDTASPILQALVKGRTKILEQFFDYGYCLKRKWFLNHTHDTMAWKAAEQISKRVPSLKTLTRKTIKTAMSKVTKIPKRHTIESLGLPASLSDYVAFQ